MAFNAQLEVINNIARITLLGELDASSAQMFRAKIEEAVQAKTKRLVLMMQGLDYMASAGLRVLAFAKQKIGTNVDIYMIGTQGSVQETLIMTGFHHSVVLMDTYDAAIIEDI